MDLGRTALAEVDLVQIGLENRLLLVSGLHQERHHRFGELPLQGLLGGEKEVLDELLSQRARPLTDAARPDVRDERTGDAAQVDAVMALETLILDCEHRVREMTRQVIEPNEITLLPVESVVGTHQLGLEQHGTDAVRYWAAAARPGVDTIDDPGQVKVGRRPWRLVLRR